MKRLLLGLLVFWINATALPAQYPSPFDAPFPEQYELLDSIIDSLTVRTPSSAAIALEEMQNQAQKTGNELAILNYKRSLIRYRYIRIYYSQDSTAIKKLVEDAQALLNTVDERRYPVIAALIHVSLGNTLNYKAYKFHDAFTHYLKAYYLFKNIPVEQFPNRQYAQYSIALSYYKFTDYENALKLGKEIELLYPKKNFISVFTVDLIGMSYLKMGNYAESIPYFQWILEHYQQCGMSPAWKGIALGNMGKAYYYQGRYAEAIPCLEQGVAITIQEKISDNAADFAAVLSSIYLQQSNAPLAKKYVDLARAEAYKSDESSNYLVVYSAMANYYRKTGDAARALLYLDSALVFKDSLVKINDVQSKHRAEITIERERLANREELFEAEKSKNIMLRNGAILFAFLTMLVVFLIFNRRYLKHKNEKEKLLARQKLAENELQNAKTQLRDFTKSMVEKNALIEKAAAEIAQITADFQQLQNQQQAPVSNAPDDPPALKRLYEAVLLTDEDWDEFTDLFNKVYPGFFIQVKLKFPQLSPAEKKFVALSKLKLDNKEMAAMLGVSLDAIRQSRSRLKKKLNLTEEASLEATIESI